MQYQRNAKMVCNGHNHCASQKSERPSSPLSHQTDQHQDSPKTISKSYGEYY